MKKVLSAFLTLFIATLLLPFAGPWLGLTSYEKRIEPPGESVTLRSGILNVRDHTGSGRPVVLLHGHPGSGQMMRPLALALENHDFRVLRYDRMGWGHSGQRPHDQPANPHAHAQDLLELVAAKGLDDPLFVGYSYGGGVVMEANRLAPDSVRHFVLLSSIGKRREQHGAQGVIGHLFNSALFKRWAFGTDYTMNVAARAISNQLMYPEQARPGELEGFLASLSLTNVPTNWAREADERYRGFDDYRPQAVRGCALVLHGEDDQVIPLATAQYVADAIPHAKLVTFANAGHGVVIAQPEKLAAVIATHERACSRA